MNTLLCLGIIAAVATEGLAREEKPSFSRSLSSLHAKGDSPLRESILELIQDYLFGDYDGMNNQPLPRHSLEIEKRSDYPGRTGRILFPGPTVEDIPVVDHLLANTAEYPQVRHVRRPLSSIGRVEPVAVDSRRGPPHPSPSTFQLDQRSNSGRQQRYMRMERISKPMVFSKISESSRNLEEQKEKLDNLGVMPQFREFSRNFQDLKEKHHQAEDGVPALPRFNRKLETASDISSLETKKDNSVSGSSQRLPKSLPPATIRSQPLIIKDARNGRSMKQIEVQGVKIIVGSRTPDFPKDDLITWRNNKVVNNNVEFDDTASSSWRSSRGLHGSANTKDNSTPGDSSQGTRSLNYNESGILTVKKTLLV